MFGHQDDQQTLNDQASSWNTGDQTQNQTTSAPPAALDNGNYVQYASSNQEAPLTPVVDDSSSTTMDTAEPVSTDDLLAIKQQALAQLSPIVDHLDQSPEERFRTTMMMIQASDNQALISEAYRAAQQITDDKQKAQALLDIVNEINYFTHPQQA